ncbi:DsrE/DsrF/DrsH-like family protein [Roseomonas gilardii subsp. gilardii]|uniref:DsrE/DsrF/DrsH-like family protein n=1 Tax=Roseomonas gilardii TaxID=257708 RepID=UPI001FF861D0|nr:DsrE/DsrF/DrsH-like family protein [Roseomonas gilardii]UPG72201.1 DsrE/DsrF/DrsH-like family protein [Roseomonas gilardii subsp. gilardii]
MAGTPLGVLLASGGHEAGHYALVAATGAAALGRRVTLFATNGGCRLLLREAPLLSDPREALMAERGVATAAELLEAALELPVRLLACEAGLRAEGLPEGALLPQVEVAGFATFLESVGAGQILTF